MGKSRRRNVHSASKADRPTRNDIQPVPSTLTGQLLLGLVLRQPEERERIRRKMDEPGGHVDSMAVIDVAFELAALRRFKPDIDLREITAFVADVRAGFGPSVNVLAMDALIRRALGEDVYIDDLDFKTVIESKVATLVAVYDVLSWNDADINKLLAEAEDLARARGYTPALAT